MFNISILKLFLWFSASLLFYTTVCHMILQ